MKRFTQLEFGENNENKDDGPQGEVIRDGIYFYREALRAWLMGDYELALRNYSRALEKNSTFYEAWVGQIMMLIELEEYPEALVWADKTLESFPEHPELLAAKAIACVRDSKMDKALAYSDNSLSKQNVTAYVWLARAEVLMARKSRMAEDCISNAISLAGRNTPIIRLEAGRLFRRNGHYSSALKHLGISVKNFPKSAMVWYEYGCCQGKLGFSEAQTAFEQSLELRPGWNIAEAALNKFKKRGFLRRLFRI